MGERQALRDREAAEQHRHRERRRLPLQHMAGGQPRDERLDLDFVQPGPVALAQNAAPHLAGILQELTKREFLEMRSLGVSRPILIGLAPRATEMIAMTDQPFYAALDVSLERTTVCVMAHDGTVIHEALVP